MQVQPGRAQPSVSKETLARPIRRLTDRRLDFPGPVPLRKSYIVASTDRCGSTFLCSMLWQTGVLGAPTEYWNLKRRSGPSQKKSVGLQMMERLDVSSPADYLKKLLACRTSKNGVFGAKAHFFDFEQAFRQFPEMLDTLSPITYIHIQRQDKVAQAVSMVKALQTGAWVSLAKPQTENLHYDKDLISKCLGFVERQNRDWARWFETHQIDPFVVTYENLIADTTGVVRSVVEFMGVRNDERREVPLPDFEKQGDETNEEWVARFRRESRADAGSREGDASPVIEVAGAEPSTKRVKALNRSEDFHVFDRYDEIKNTAARPMEAKRLRHRYDAIVGQNRELFRNARVLDIYSADGRWISAALDAGAKHVVGLDSEQAQVEAAKNALAKLGVNSALYEFVNAEIIAALRTFPSESFDLVLCQDFSRLADPHLFFHRLRRLRPKHVILDTGIAGGKVPMASFRLKERDKAKSQASMQSLALRVVPNHELIRILCDYFDFRWRVIDWRALGIGDWNSIHDYERGRRRTYVLDRAV